MTKTKFFDEFSQYTKPSLEDKTIIRKKHSTQTSERLKKRQQEVAEAVRNLSKKESSEKESKNKCVCL